MANRMVSYSQTSKIMLQFTLDYNRPNKYKNMILLLLFSHVNNLVFKTILIPRIRWHTTDNLRPNHTHTTPTPHPHHTNTTPIPQPHHTHTTPTPHFKKKSCGVGPHHTTTFFKKCGVGVVWLWCWCGVGEGCQLCATVQEDSSTRELPMSCICMCISHDEHLGLNDFFAAISGNLRPSCIQNFATNL